MPSRASPITHELFIPRAHTEGVLSCSVAGFKHSFALSLTVRTILIRLLIPTLAAPASPETSPTALPQNPRRYSVSIFSRGTPALMTCA